MHRQYLHRVNEIGRYLDHQLRPEVRAMLLAMTSRMPAGGLEQRYDEVVDALLAETRDEFECAGLLRSPAMKTPEKMIRRAAEDKLTAATLPAKVVEFLDKNVGQYGHGSVQELVGDPPVNFEGVSWWTAWLLLDSPLVAGQEASTRALNFAKRGMCVEAGDDPVLRDLHERWLEIFRAELAVWQADPTISKDPQPFRPAFDRARWALPGTIATSVSTASYMRERSRVIRDGLALAEASGDTDFIRTWTQIRETYAAASPVIARYALREAVVEEGGIKIPGHLDLHTSNPGDLLPEYKEQAGVFRVPVELLYTRAPRGYLDPGYNHTTQAAVRIPCSLAVARDWHRHRTFYPWFMSVDVNSDDQIMIHDAYGPRSALALEKLGGLLLDTSAYFAKMIQAGNPMRARLALPFGTAVRMHGAAGLRDATYMLELRAFTQGANFEYEAQAQALLKLQAQAQAQAPHQDAAIPPEWR